MLDVCVNEIYTQLMSFSLKSLKKNFHIPKITFKKFCPQKIFKFIAESVAFCECYKSNKNNIAMFAKKKAVKQKVIIGWKIVKIMTCALIHNFSIFEIQNKFMIFHIVWSQKHFYQQTTVDKPNKQDHKLIRKKVQIKIQSKLKKNSISQQWIRKKSKKWNQN